MVVAYFFGPPCISQYAERHRHARRHGEHWGGEAGPLLRPVPLGENAAGLLYTAMFKALKPLKDTNS